MPRIPYVEADNEPDELRPVFEQLRATRGQVPGMYRLLAHHPKVLAAHRAYFDAALDNGYLPRRFKEMIAVKAASLCGTDYSSASHRRYARAHGVTDEEIAAVDSGDYTSLKPDERAALEFTEAFVREQGAVSDEACAALRRHFDETGFVEIVALIGIMQLAAAFGAAFDLRPD